jgi:6-phosphogluconolactonase
MRVGDARVVILADEEAVSRAAADATVAALHDAIARRGQAHLALTGGSSAVALYRLMAGPPWQTALDWRDVHFWWGDDRFVPRDHPESNAGMAYRILFNVAAWSAESGTGAEGVDVEAGAVPGLLIDPEKVHPFETEEAIANGQGGPWAAQRYMDQLASLAPPAAGSDAPAFDVFHLGVGPDGHTMSVFPGSYGVKDTAPVVIPMPAPEHVEPHLPRITLSTRVLAAAGAVIMMVSGASKAEVMAKVLGPEREVAHWPAQAALLPNATWYLDEAAATNLP